MYLFLQLYFKISDLDQHFFHSELNTANLTSWCVRCAVG